MRLLLTALFVFGLYGLFSIAAIVNKTVCTTVASNRGLYSHWDAKTGCTVSVDGKHWVKATP